MNLVWRVRMEDAKCAHADVKKIPGDPARIQADIACFASSRGDQLTYAGDLYFPLEQAVKKADVSKIGMCEFLARLQSQQRNALKHNNTLEAYFSSQKVIKMKIGEFCYVTVPSNVPREMSRDVDLGVVVVEPSDEFTITGLEPTEEEVAAAELTCAVEVTGLEPDEEAVPAAAAAEAAVPVPAADEASEAAVPAEAAAAEAAVPVPAADEASEAAVPAAAAAAEAAVPVPAAAEAAEAAMPVPALSAVAAQG
jgi:hypothetical protein